MDRSTPIGLCSTRYTEDEFNVLQPRETTRNVFADVQTVTRAEWFEGGRNGLNPQYKFTMFKPDYEGEEIVNYQGQQHAVYRTFEPRTDEIELYCELKKGTEVKDL